MTKSIVPDDFKVACVVPLYNKGDHNLEGNYRPISILPVVSKVFERIVHNQLTMYLNSFDILYDYQSGFRKDFSTDSALVYLTDRIRSNSDKGNFTGLVLMDLQKAFDTVNHDIILNKLRTIGFKDDCIKWFRSYLCNRKQFTDVNGQHSEFENVTCGVPQGSILGPLLFLVYVNDMSASVQCELYLYADDSALLTTGKSIEHIESVLEGELKNVSKWLIDNKLSLHLGKTESVIYGPPKKVKDRVMNINIDGIMIKGKDSVKYLGAHLDQCLTGVTMATNAIKKVNKCLKFMYRKSEFLNFKERLMMSNALIQPTFDYGCNFWFRSLGKVVRSKLQVTQNKVIRFVLEKGNRYHVAVSDFRKLKWISVEKRVDFMTLCNMFKIYHKKAPKYLCHIDFIKDSHSHNTRYSTMSFSVPSVKTQGKHTFKYSGIFLWNNLPMYVKQSQFKHNCKKFQIDSMAR